MLRTSNLITISSTIDAQRSKPVCMKLAEQYVYVQNQELPALNQLDNTSDQLRSIGKLQGYENIPRILPFGAIKDKSEIYTLTEETEENLRKTLISIYLNKLEPTIQT